MGIFSFLSKENRERRSIEGAIRSANNKFKPTEYRQAALSEVFQGARKGNEQAIAALLTRFAIQAEPSTEDEKEKGWVFDELVSLGQAALPQIRKALRFAEGVNWHHRVLRNIVSPEEYKQELLSVLSEFDIEYARNPDRKAQTIMALAEVSGEEISAALVPFLRDVNETVRFHTVVALAAQGACTSREPLLQALLAEESIRVRNEIIATISRLGWLVTGYRKQVEERLEKTHRVNKEGKIVKLGQAE